MTSINQIINNDIIIIIITAIIVSIAIIKVLEAVEELISSIRELFFGKKQKVRQAIALKTNSFFTPPTAIQQQPTLVDQPIMVVEQPAVIVAQPTMVLEQPAVIVAQPTMVLEQPAVIVDQPTMVLAQPAVIVDQPTMVLAQPATIDEQPTTIVPLLSKAPLGVIFKKEETTINSKKNESEYGALSSQKANELFAKTYGGLSVSKTNTKLSFAEDLIQYVNVDYNCTWIAGERDAIQGNWNRVLAHADHSMNAMHHEEAKALCQGDRMRASSLTDDERDELRVEIAEFESNFKPVAQCTKPEVDPNQVDDLYPVRPNQAGTRDWSHSRAWTPSARPKPVVFPTLPPVTVAAPVVQVSDTTSTTATNDNDSMDVDMEDVEEPVIEEPIILATAPATPTKLYLSVGSWKKLLKPKLQPTLAPIAELVILATAPANPTKLYMRAGEWKKSLKPKFQPTLAPIAEPMILATAPATPTKLDMDIGTWKKFLKPKFRPTLEPIVEVLATAPHEPTKLRLSVGSWKKFVKPKLQPTLEPIVEVLATAPHEPTKLRLSVGSWKKLVKPKLQPTLETTMEEDEQQQQEEYLEAEPTDNDTRRLPPRRSARLQAKQNVRTPTVEPERPVSRRPKRRRQPPGFYKESLTYRQG